MKRRKRSGAGGCLYGDVAIAKLCTLIRLAQAILLDGVVEN